MGSVPSGKTMRFGWRFSFSNTDSINRDMGGIVAMEQGCVEYGIGAGVCGQGEIRYIERIFIFPVAQGCQESNLRSLTTTGSNGFGP